MGRRTRPLTPTGGSELVYTSGVQFKVGKGNATVRIGPLAYITSDVEEASVPSDFSRRYTGPMQYKMCRGVYRVHRVKTTKHRHQTDKKKKKKSREQWDSPFFTVITLENMDPEKIVDGLERYTAVTTNAIRKDLFFDNRRWMMFAGKKSPMVDEQQLSRLHKTWNVDGRENDDTPYRDALRECLAITAYTCKLSWSREVCYTKETVVQKNDMISGDRCTLYVRVLSKPMVGDLRVELSPPDMTGFTVRCGKCRSPSAVGIYHDDGLGHGMCGYVLYTKTDVDGKPLPRDRVFAIVVGSAFISNVCAVSDRSPDAFGPSVHCRDFLYGERRTTTSSAQLQTWCRYLTTREKHKRTNDDDDDVNSSDSERAGKSVCTRVEDPNPAGVPDTQVNNYCERTRLNDFIDNVASEIELPQNAVPPEIYTQERAVDILKFLKGLMSLDGLETTTTTTDPAAVDCESTQRAPTTTATGTPSTGFDEFGSPESENSTSPPSPSSQLLGDDYELISREMDTWLSDFNPHLLDGALADILDQDV